LAFVSGGGRPQAGGNTVRRYRCASGPEWFSRIHDPGFPLAVTRPKPDAGADPGIPRWTSECSGKSLPGVTAVATCDPLVPIP